MTVRDHNLAAVLPLLDGSPYPARAVEANEVLAAVDLDLVTAAGVLRVRLAPNLAEKPAFARSTSLSISYLPDPDGAPIAPAALGALRLFARHLATRDRGGIALHLPQPGDHRPTLGPHHDPTPGARRLPVLGDAAATSDGTGAGAGEASWSRPIFDRNLAALAAEKGSFLSAILVVVQPCEMACQFCPSGDLARTVQPDLELDGQHADLLHQLAAARALAVDTLEIGGNDVLRFPRALELFRAAGALGFRRISAQSPGQRLADPDFARALADTPLDRLDLPIYGATAADHDAVTRTPGSFDALCRAIDTALPLARPAIVLHTIALASTLPRLDALLAFGQRRFGLPIRVQMLRPNRVGERDHLTDAAPLPAIAEAARRNPSHFGDDLPLCTLPGERAHEIHRERTRVTAAMRALAPPSNTPEASAFGHRLHLWDLGLAANSEHALVKQDRSAAFPPACDHCALRGTCLGVLRAYLDRFGDTAIVPFKTAD